MTCRYCQTRNDEDDHRCSRCGRRLYPSGPQPIASATAPAYDYAEPPPLTLPQAEMQVELAPPRQPSLFPLRDPRKVIPFSSIATPALAAQPAGRSSSPPARERSPRRRNENQADLNFPAPQMRRSLETSVEAAIACNAKVAPASLRVRATIADLGYLTAAMVLLAVPVLAAPLLGMRAPLPEGKLLLAALCAGGFLAALFYHAIWALADTETPGMRARGLRLLNFDGHPPVVRQRIARLAAGVLSLASLGVGMLWILCDEEHLAWHDHISKTFPTQR